MGGGGDDIWDATGSGGVGSGGFDLADFAAASAKFRADMEKMTFQDEKGDAEEDTMEQLHRQQQLDKKVVKAGLDALVDDELGGLVDDEEDALGGVEVDEEDDIPDWADEDDAAELLRKKQESEANSVKELEKAKDSAVAAPDAKRNLLLGVWKDDY